MSASSHPTPRVDASLDAELNGVRLPDGRVVSWAVAFPRDYETIFKGIGEGSVPLASVAV